MKRPVSKASLAANRRNARKSTGPKTPEGKARARQNALKHGLLAREVVVSDGDGDFGPLAAVQQPTGTDSHDLSALRLLFGRFGQHQAGSGNLFLLGWFDDQAIRQWLQLHGHTVFSFHVNR